MNSPAHGHTVATTRAQTEHWFVRRGVPHFIEDYSASEDVLTRAAPALVLIFLFSAISAPDLDWPLWGFVLASVAGLALLIGGWAVLNRLRGRRLLAPPSRIGWIEIAVFLLFPTLLPLLFGGDWKGALITFVTLLTLLGVVYAATSYSLVALIVWAFYQLLRTLGQTFRLFTRSLPLLLIGFMFIFINAEAWQSAGQLDRSYLVAAAVGLGLLAAAFLATQIPRETEGLDVFRSWRDIVETVADAPVDVGRVDPADPPSPPPLTSRERGNIWLVFFVSQGLRLVLVSTLVGALFVVLGLLIIQPDTISLWIGSPPDILVTFTVFDMEMTMTRELLQVSGFLAAFAAVYFSVYAATDPNLRSEFFEHTAAEMHQNLAVRAIYRMSGSDDDGVGH